MLPPAFAIYSDHAIRARLRPRRWRSVGLFAAGILVGLALSQSGGWPPAAYAQTNAGSLSTPAPDCTDPMLAGNRLRLACSLQPR